MVQDKPVQARSGYAPLCLAMALLLGSPFLFFLLNPESPGAIVFQALGQSIALVVLIGLPVTGIVLAVLILNGLAIVNPNESRVLILFGDYVGTIEQAGFYWVNPFYLKKLVSRRVRTFETGSMTESTTKKDAAGNVTTETGPRRRHPAKVNDLDGNPIEIASVVVWRVVDSAKALFDVDRYEDYVQIQSESALRNLASRYPYDSHEEHRPSLRGSPEAVGEELKRELAERLTPAGVEVLEARLSMLAYAPEIAAVMLRRQQASAILAARRIIVDGAVGMVEMALDRLDREGKVKLDEERKAAMVSNLLVVLCGEKDPQPVVNTGSLYTG
ncbi:MAG: SPFH domain-containing protein [Planctomycetota bacterium]